MRIFAFEFFSGGGLAGQPLPPGIAREGDMMLGALLRDLAELPEVEVVASRDQSAGDFLITGDATNVAASSMTQCGFPRFTNV